MTDTELAETDDRAERIADSVREQLETDEGSRRSFLSRSAVAGGALLALGGGTGLAIADEHEAEEPDEPMGASFDDVAGTDLDVLNYALSLEHLENAFYSQAMELFDETAFMEAEALADYSEERRAEVYARVESVAMHEQAHVDVLTQAVELLGGDPATEGTYTFDLESVEGFLGLAQVFENTGVAAYAGAAPYIESPDLLSAALSIHSVEARHAALFNELNGDSPFPDAFDAASSQQEVLDAVAPYVAADPTDGGEGGSGNETATDDGTGNTTVTDDGTGNTTVTDDGTGNTTATETDGSGQ